MAFVSTLKIGMGFLSVDLHFICTRYAVNLMSQSIESSSHISFHGQKSVKWFHIDCSAFEHNSLWNFRIAKQQKWMMQLNFQLITWNIHRNWKCFLPPRATFVKCSVSLNNILSINVRCGVLFEHRSLGSSVAIYRVFQIKFFAINKDRIRTMLFSHFSWYYPQTTGSQTQLFIRLINHKNQLPNSMLWYSLAFMRSFYDTAFVCIVCIRSDAAKVAGLEFYCTHKMVTNLKCLL